MKPDSCNEIPFEVLVDYSDGEIADDARASLDEHLKKCEVCREKLQALERSLQIAQLIWRNTEAQIGRTHTASKPHRFISAWRVAIAASVLFAMAVFLIKHISRQQPPHPIPAPVQQATLEEIKQKIRRAGLAAQLFATAEVLDKVEGGQATAEKQYAYIVEHYSDTDQAVQARRRLEERRNP